jgi:hypothetical protein
MFRTFLGYLVDWCSCCYPFREIGLCLIILKEVDEWIYRN